MRKDLLEDRNEQVVEPLLSGPLVAREQLLHYPFLLLEREDLLLECEHLYDVTWVQLKEPKCFLQWLSLILI